ncbi:MAG: elongation factor G [Vicinamibacterales bacterium]|jgi:elongation factor G|nr:elongation factor G [Acidobacteriota bacterium]MDP7294343.1 elongation factor G [Vicinamibacterales bacterium]MDP7480566.1 elongation factor G [Vicinamibacterales bacterium]MDP7672185.1 elongation factor G [Vicinamibacterales bacterium]HJO37427.1 elongation factor G [Vicinamibacterales bacterium]|tara:strand:+ start:2539 stop:4635 length:2097 start_codon:yes stop_codon:yes gene_type:complete
MKVYDTPSIRNVAIVGHSGSGKTQLTSALLFDAGMVNRLGTVDEGTTVTDFDEEAIERKHTLSACAAYAEWNKTKINLIDTPGIANFLSEARAALSVSDVAAVVVDAVAGVEVQTEKTWAAAQDLGLPRVVVLNRLDRERASLDRSLESLREVLGRSIVPIQIPLGEEKSFRGVVDLVSMKSLIFTPDGDGKATIEEIPDDIAPAAKTARDALIEMVAEADEGLMEKFFEAGTLTQAELEAGLRTAVLAGQMAPMLCTSATLNIGIVPLLDALVTYTPSPADRPFAGADASGESVEVAAAGDGPAAAFVWKTIADPFAGRITMFRVVSGVFKADKTVHNLTKDAAERFGSLLVLQGKTQTSIGEIRAGDLGAVAKLKDTHTGDTLADKGSAVSFPPFTFPEPVLSYAIEPKSRGDEEKISVSLQRIREEDPTIQYGRDGQTGELLLSGQGQLHIEVTVAKLKRRFGVEVNLKLPRIAYRETILAATEAHGRHKKQTGGHGQFGDCKIRMEPLPRGGDFEFANEIFGGAIPRQLVPAIEKGIQEERMRGYLAGYPVVDFKVTVYDGSFHQVDSNEMSFKMAGRLAFKDAMTRARPTLLEPVMNVEIYAPSEFAGDLMGDLNGRRGRIGGMEPRGSMTAIKAQVPMSEMLTYEQQLTSATGGRGAYHMEFSHYEEVPAHLHGKIVSAAKAERGEAAPEEA